MVFSKGDFGCSQAWLANGLFGSAASSQKLHTRTSVGIGFMACCGAKGSMIGLPLRRLIIPVTISGWMSGLPAGNSVLWGSDWTPASRTIIGTDRFKTAWAIA